MPDPLPEKFVAGLDGCKAGWVMVTWSGRPDTSPQAAIIPDFRIALATAATHLGVDMPIGFPADTERTCESLARQLLGPRKSSVFAVPCRQAVYADDYPSGCEINANLTGKKFSKQSYHLFPKMREIDAAITPADQARVFEIHPEVSFRAMNADTALEHYKKTPEGAALRTRLLRDAGFPIDRLQHPAWPKSKAASDDIIDACACCWSAWRIASNTHITLPPDPEYDARGFRMEINA